MLVDAAAQQWKVDKASLVTDAGFVKTGLVDPVCASLRDAGIEVTVWSDVVADPPEALVLQAAALGKQGETFVLDMGEPVRVLDLATEMRESWNRKGKRSGCTYSTWLRPGLYSPRPKPFG